MYIYDEEREQMALEEHGRLGQAQNGDRDGDDDDDDYDDDDTQGPFCLCRGPDDKESPMIFCDGCEDWFHFRCIDLSEEDAETIGQYYCPNCTARTGLRTKKIWELPPSQAGSDFDDADDQNREAAPSAAGEDTEKINKGKAPAARNASKGVLRKSAGTSKAKKGVQKKAAGVAKTGKESKGQRRARSSTPPEDEESSEVEIEEDADDIDDEDYVEKEENTAKNPLPAPSKSPTIPSPAHVSKKPPSATKRKASIPADDASRGKNRRTSMSSRTSASPQHEREGHGQSQDKGAGKAGTSDSAHADPVRTHCLEQFKTTLRAIFASSDATTQAEGDNSVVSASEQAALEYATSLESALFELHSTLDAKTRRRVPSHFYKEKFRSLFFNLRDRKNTLLRTRIVSNGLSPSALANASSADLANETLRNMAESVRKASMADSIREKQKGPITKMTHKGMVMIEDGAITDGGGSTNRETEAVAEPIEPIIHGPVKRDSISGTLQKSPITPSREDSLQSPTIGSEMRFSRDESLDHGGRDSPPQAHGREGGRVGSISMDQRSPAAATHRASFDLSSVWASVKAHAPAHEEVGEAGAEAKAEGEGGHGSAGEAAGPEGDMSAADIEEKEEKGNVDEEYDPFDFEGKGRGSEMDDMDIDDILNPDAVKSNAGEQPANQGDSAAPADADVAKTAGAGAEVPKVAEALATSPPLPVIWRGKISLPDEGAFPAQVTQVGGRPLGEAPDIWKHFFPTDSLTIEGRVPVERSSEYLVQSRLSSKTELVLLAIRLSDDTRADDDAAAAAARRQGMEKVLHFLKHRSRYGVFLPRKESKATVKDFYLVPLEEEDPLPEWVELLENHKVLEEGRRVGAMFLGVAVLHKTAFQPNQSAQPSSSAPVSNAPPSSSDPAKPVVLPPGPPPKPPTFPAPTAASIAPPAVPDYTPSSTSALAQSQWHPQPGSSLPPATTMPAAPPNLSALQELLKTNPNVLKSLLNTSGGGTASTGDGHGASAAQGTTHSLGQSTALPSAAASAAAPAPPGAPPALPPQLAALAATLAAQGGGASGGYDPQQRPAAQHGSYSHPSSLLGGGLGSSSPYTGASYDSGTGGGGYGPTASSSQSKGSEGDRFGAAGGAAARGWTNERGGDVLGEWHRPNGGSYGGGGGEYAPGPPGPPPAAPGGRGYDYDYDYDYDYGRGPGPGRDYGYGGGYGERRRPEYDDGAPPPPPRDYDRDGYADDGRGGGSVGGFRRSGGGGRGARGGFRGRRGGGFRGRGRGRGY